MKYYKILMILMFVSSLLFFSCEENVHEPINFDNQPPGDVTSVVLTPVAGGFDIKYVAPTDTDLLYVKASFETESLGSTELRASKYDNAFLIRGYASADEKTVSFISVDKSGNESKGVSEVGVPLESPLKDIETSMSIVADFGGARFNWDNSTEGNVVIQLLVENEIGELEISQTLYSSVKEGIYNLRGLAPVPTKFAAVISDQYKNVSDTIFPNTPDKLLTPRLESPLNKELFSQHFLPNDEIWTTFGGVVEELWNGVIDVTGDYARATLVNDKTYFTMDLGVNVKLSRFKLHQRRTRYYSDGAPKVYTVYGTNTEPSADGDMSSWTKLIDCVATSPTGNSHIADNAGQKTLNSEELEYVLNGDEFGFGDNSPEVRYIRIEFKENWIPSGFIIFSELSFWGEIQ